MTTPIFERIKHDIENNDVVLFMKGTAEQPACGFSMQVVQVLSHLNVPFFDINVLTDDDIRQGIKEYNDWPTIPQLFVKGEFVGGCDIVLGMYQDGELQKLLQDKGLIAI